MGNCNRRYRTGYAQVSRLVARSNHISKRVKGEPKSIGFKDLLSRIRFIQRQETLPNPQNIESCGIENATVTESVPCFLKEESLFVTSNKPVSFGRKGKACGFA